MIFQKQALDDVPLLVILMMRRVPHVHYCCHYDLGSQTHKHYPVDVAYFHPYDRDLKIAKRLSF